MVLNKKCEVCNEENCLTYSLEKYHVITCSKCGCMYTEEVYPSNAEYKEYKLNPSIIEKIYTKMTHHYIHNLDSNEYLLYLKSKTKMNFKTALDIGTGYGTFVELLNKNGIEATGLESNQKIVKLSFSKQVKWQYFDEYYKSDVKYDLICLNQITPYLRNNFSVLKCVKNMLSDNGLIFVVTTNPESSLVQLGIPIRPSYANMILSKKNFQSLENTIGLKLLDYTVYKSNIAIDFRPPKNTKIAFMKYFLKLNKPMVIDQDGN